MEVRNCRNCGKLFNYIGGVPICPSCKEALEDKFEEVKQYIYNNPNSNIQEVADDTDVSVPQIKQWIREERLTFAEGSSIGLECENCGAIIRTGRFCPHCKELMASRLGQMYKAKPQKQNKVSTDSKSKMRFLDN